MFLYLTPFYNSTYMQVDIIILSVSVAQHHAISSTEFNSTTQVLQVYKGNNMKLVRLFWQFRISRLCLIFL